MPSRVSKPTRLLRSIVTAASDVSDMGLPLCRVGSLLRKRRPVLIAPQQDAHMAIYPGGCHGCCLAALGAGSDQKSHRKRPASILSKLRSIPTDTATGRRRVTPHSSRSRPSLRNSAEGCQRAYAMMIARDLHLALRAAVSGMSMSSPGSHETLRRRKVDSNPRSHPRGSRCLSRTETSQARRMCRPAPTRRS
jgi:hypothetical protein